MAAGFWLFPRKWQHQKEYVQFSHTIDFYVWGDYKTLLFISGNEICTGGFRNRIYCNIDFTENKILTFSDLFEPSVANDEILKQLNAGIYECSVKDRAIGRPFQSFYDIEGFYFTGNDLVIKSNEGVYVEYKIARKSLNGVLKGKYIQLGQDYNSY